MCTTNTVDIPCVVQAYVNDKLHFFLGRKHGLQDSATSLDHRMPRQEQSEEAYLEIHVNDGVLRLSTAEVLHKLPDHIMACVALWEEGKSMQISADMECTLMEYVCHVVRLFVSLCPMFRVMTASLELFNAEYQMRLVDSISLVLLVISSEAGRMKMMHAVSGNSDPVLLRDVNAMVGVAPSCIQAVLLFMTERDRGIKNIERASEDVVIEFDEEFEIGCILGGLELHPRGWVFLDAAIESTRVITHMLVLLLRQKNHRNPLNALGIAKGVEYSMAILEWVVANQGVYTMYLQHDANAASLGRLICTSLDLVTNGMSIPPFLCVVNSNKYTYEPQQRQPGCYFYPTDCCEGYAECIAARACAMIVSLGNHSPSFYALLCEKDEESKSLARVMSQGVMGILKQILRRPTIDAYTASLGEGQLALNCLRAASVFGKKDTFKQFKSILQGEVAILLSTMAPGDFKSFWGPGCLAIRYMNVDVHNVNGSSEILKIQQNNLSALLERGGGQMFRDVVTGLPEILHDQYSEVIQRGLKLALERSVLLIKFIAGILSDVELRESRFCKHLGMFVENGAHDYLMKNLHCICTLAHRCTEYDVIKECEVRLLDTVTEAIIHNF